MSTNADMRAPVQFLKGCGAARAQLLEKLGVRTVRDLLFFFPRQYDDLTELRAIGELEEGQPATVLATVEEVELRQRGTGRSVVGMLVRQADQFLQVLWFDQPFQAERFRQGQQVLLSGKVKQHAARWQMIHPQAKPIAPDGTPPAGELLPVYPLTQGLAQRHVRQLVQRALEAGIEGLEEVFPREYLAQHNLLPLATALPWIHFPPDLDSLAAARRRFVYQELLVLQLALALKRFEFRRGEAALRLADSARIDARIRRLFPFELTAAQNAAIAEIAADLAQTQPMNRLLQGDVGSGKTVVAAYLMLLAVAHGAQAVLMAPTEILARQHHETLGALLAASRVKLGLLTGAVTGKAREELVGQVAAGEIQILIGTQAVVEEELAFARLALVVIDEQHKFGVRQRSRLKHGGGQPHYLVMTATPIPRTVGMTLFGDLDVTTLAGAPPGRQPVHTYLPPPEDRARWWEFFRKKLREGRQGYVITPLVAGGEDTQVANLEATFEELANGELEAFRLNLVHGRMSAAQKDAAMSSFRAGQTQVLVATSVVEVGVDVPNATLMTVQSADRFGLAQLHQLRGRVSRGSHPGFCCLFADDPSPAGQQRLQALVDSHDGFALAETDFALRGPGDLLGTQQHGLPPLRIADLAADAAVLEEARRDARELVALDPGLQQPEHALLRRMALVRYSHALELGDVG